jgi:hypothetical protein
MVHKGLTKQIVFRLIPNDLDAYKTNKYNFGKKLFGGLMEFE